ncbi:MAG TPA: YjbH domain-containing protein [bacterium]|nr:YjbH domain-containing protein [bacterium]HPG45760.1 YjbH domain-containing protein [bacterium]HPM98013.1 YjbH domain-containing protein [bacterium]
MMLKTDALYTAVNPPELWSRRICLWVLLWLLLFLPPHQLIAQTGSLMGPSGVLLVPSATVAADGEIAVGVSRIPELYASRLRPYERSVFYGRIGYLPFLELTAMVIRPDHYSGGIGDRSGHIKLRLMPEGRSWPALAVGAQDFFAIDEFNLEPWGAQHFAALYAVASKTFIAPRSIAVRLHAGYGWDDLPAYERYLVGPFAGVEITPHPWIDLLAEYDSQEFNVGMRLHLFSKLHLVLALWKLQEFTSSVAISFVL